MVDDCIYFLPTQEAWKELPSSKFRVDSYYICLEDMEAQSI